MRFQSAERRRLEGVLHRHRAADRRLDQEPTGEESPADLYEFELTSDPATAARAPDRPERRRAPGQRRCAEPDPGQLRRRLERLLRRQRRARAGREPGRLPAQPRRAKPLAAGRDLQPLRLRSPTPGPRRSARRASSRRSPAKTRPTGAPADLANSPPLAARTSASLTSSVSPNGRYLAFMSDAALTGYDNRDAHERASPTRRSTSMTPPKRRLSCASCNSSGGGGGWKRPHGVFDTELAGEGLGLLVDRPEIWNERWLAGSLPGWAFNINGSASRGALPAALPLRQRAAVLQQRRRARAAGHQRQGGRLRVRAARRRHLRSNRAAASG